MGGRTEAVTEITGFALSFPSGSKMRDHDDKNEGTCCIKKTQPLRLHSTRLSSGPRDAHYVAFLAQRAHATGPVSKISGTRGHSSHALRSAMEASGVRCGIDLGVCAPPCVCVRGCVGACLLQGGSERRRGSLRWGCELNGRRRRGFNKGTKRRVFHSWAAAPTWRFTLVVVNFRKHYVFRLERVWRAPLTGNHLHPFAPCWPGVYTPHACLCTPPRLELPSGRRAFFLEVL